VTRLQDKVAIITGGGTGIGRAIALAFGREGAKVVVAGRRVDKLEAAANELRKAGAQALVVTCDVTSADQTQALVQKAEKAFDHVNILVNNAGTLSVSTVESIPEDEWDSLMNTNLKGPYLMSRAALPALRRAGGGSIINIGSVLGLVAVKERAAYCASKGGITMLTKAMALDHAAENIRVNCICPSVVETDLVRDMFSDSEAGQKARAARLATFPLGRFGRPEDVAELAVFLASEESSWMTGTALPLDGGVTAN
jgi:NAD(P)-dependent dehydrogenase (short-subunit alcohol dehydrogenase family)